MHLFPTAESTLDVSEQQASAAPQIDAGDAPRVLELDQLAFVAGGGPAGGWSDGPHGGW